MTCQITSIKEYGIEITQDRPSLPKAQGLIRAAGSRMFKPCAIATIDELRLIRDLVTDQPDAAELALQSLITEFGGDPNP